MARRNPNAPYWVQLARAEKQILEYTLAQTDTGDNFTQAAELLGVSVSFISERVRELGVVYKRREDEDEEHDEEAP
jgi:DNA-binding NtrC family response regulator